MWAVQLEAAAEWGTPPHVLFGGTVAQWFARWKSRRDVIVQKAK